MARALSIAEVTTTVPAPVIDHERPLALGPKQILTDGFEITFEGEGAIGTFRLTLCRQPWPEVGQRVSYTSDCTQLIGRVTKATFTPITSRGRWKCGLVGAVEVFVGDDAFGGSGGSLGLHD